MKKNINLGAYGWRHKHWLNTFYPEDLPINGSEDWRLSYYSNEFNAVLVPFDYWQSRETVDCEGWLDDVNEDFQFFVEYHESMLVNLSLLELTDSLKKLQPQLSALVFLGNKQHRLLPAGLPGGESFKQLVDALQVDVCVTGAGLNSTAHNVWQQDNFQNSRFAFVDSDLCDLKSARMMLENLGHSAISAERRMLQKTSRKAGSLADEAGGNLTIIVNHPKLQASNLSKFRAILEIMGH